MTKTIGNTVESYETTFEAKTPISHGADSSQGTRQRLRTLRMKMPEEVDAEFDDIPVVSGNSLRGQLRDLLAQDFLERIDVELHDTLSNSFWSGGTPESDTGGATIDRRQAENIRELVPPLSLLGGSVGNIIEGKLKVGMLVPIGVETQEYTGVESQKSVWEYKDKTYYTRTDDRDGGRDGEEQKQQMKYEVDVLIPGTQFHHSLDLVGASEVERGALHHAFDLFDEQPYIGGMSRVGHGEVEHGYDFDGADAYLKFVENNEDEIREFVLELDEKLT